jgi:hypothetical protein
MQVLSTPSLRVDVLVLRRVGGGSDKPAALRLAHQGRQEELGGTPHRGVRLLEEGAISGVRVVLPQVVGEPRTAGEGRAPVGPLAWRGEVPRVGDDVCHPAVGAVVRLRRLLAVRHELRDEPEQRPVAVRQVRRLCQPVVHLDVDVQVEVAVPRRLHLLRPEPLEVGGEGAVGSGRTDQQVAPEVEGQSREGRVLRDVPQPLRHRIECAWPLRQFQDRPAVEAPVVLNVLSLKARVGALGGGIDPLERLSRIALVEHTGAGGEEQRSFVRAVYADPVCGRRRLATFRHHPETSLEADPVPTRHAAAQGAGQQQVVAVHRNHRPLGAR